MKIARTPDHFRPRARVSALVTILTLALGTGWMTVGHAASLNYTGQLELIVTDTGGGRYAGSPPGRVFNISFNYGLESEATTDPASPGDYDFPIPPFGASITDGTIVTAGSPTPAGIVQVSVVDGQVLDAENASLVNALLGTSLSAGATLDLSDIDTQSVPEVGGQIVFGLAFLSLDAMAFTGLDFGNFGPESGSYDHAFFFIAEENANGDVVYEGYGRATVVPLPAGGWLLGTGVIALVARNRIRRRAR